MEEKWAWRREEGQPWKAGASLKETPGGGSVEGQERVRRGQKTGGPMTV